MTFEAYSVAVRLSLTDLVTPGLAIISRGMRTIQSDAAGAQRSVTDLERRLQSIKSMGLIGGVFAGVGAAGMSLFDAPLKAAREYELAFTKFKTLNLGEAVNKQADHFARSADIMGVSAKQLMTTMSESVGLFGSFSEAQKLAPKLAELNMANSAIFGGKIGAMDEGGARSLFKFIDRRGGTKDDASFLRNLNLAEKMVTGSGGFIKFRDLDQFSQQGGTAFRGLSDAGILNMALLLQEQGGSRAGTSLMSFHQNLIAGRTPKKTMAMLQEFGLGHLDYETHATVGGKPLKSLVMRDIKGGDLLQANPPEWMRSVFLPALASHGITSEAGILKTTNDLLSQRTASSQGSIMSTQVLQLLRDANLAKNAMGADDVVKAWHNDPSSKYANLQARWIDTLRELGTTVLPMAIKGVEGLTSSLKTVIELAQEFPKATKGTLVLFAGLSAAAAAGGSIALATAGFKAMGLALGMGGAAASAGLVGAIGLATVGIGALAYSLHDLYRATHHEGVVTSADSKARLRDPAVLRQLHEFDGDFTSKIRLNLPAVDTSGGLSLGFNPVAPPQRQGAMINNKIVMPDGRVLASVVTEVQAREMSRPLTSAGAFDGRMNLVPAGGY